MACYHFTLKPVSKGKGASAVAKAAYHSGERLSDSYYGNVQDYTKKAGIVYKEIFLPSHALERLKNRETLWNEVELVEKNKRAQLANNFEIALINEFSMEDNILLAKAFVKDQFVARGMIADVAIHDPPRKPGEEPNPHIHVMCPLRPLNEDGTWGIKQKKEIVLDENGQPVIGSNGKPKERAYSVTGWNSKDTLQEYRKAWADLVNEFAELTNTPIRVDHRSLKEQGIDRLPTIHEGSAVREMEKKGIRTAIGDLNRMIRYVNARITQIRELFDWIKARKQELEEKFESARSEVRSPNLANYLIDYYDKRNRNAEQFQYGTQKAKVTNLKQLAEITNYLEQEQIKTPAQLQERISSLSDRFNQVRTEIEEQLSINKDYKERLRAWELYQKTKPVFDEYQKKRFLKEKFRKEHQKEINTYHWANRYLKPDLSLREKIASVQKDLLDGIAASDMTVIQLVERYLATKNSVRQSTRQGYKTVTNFLARDPFGQKKIDKIKTSDVKLWFIKLQKEEGKGYSTIHTIRGVLRPAFNLAVEDDLIRKNPFQFPLMDVIINDSIRREALTPEQEREFLRFIQQDPHYCKYYGGVLYFA